MKCLFATKSLVTTEIRNFYCSYIVLNIHVHTITPVFYYDSQRLCTSTHNFPEIPHSYVPFLARLFLIVLPGLFKDIPNLIKVSTSKSTSLHVSIHIRSIGEFVRNANINFFNKTKPSEHILFYPGHVFYFLTSNLNYNVLMDSIYCAI